MAHQPGTAQLQQSPLHRNCLSRDICILLCPSCLARVHSSHQHAPARSRVVMCHTTRQTYTDSTRRLCKPATDKRTHLKHPPMDICIRTSAGISQPLSTTQWEIQAHNSQNGIKCHHSKPEMHVGHTRKQLKVCKIYRNSTASSNLVARRIVFLPSTSHIQPFSPQHQPLRCAHPTIKGPRFRSTRTAHLGHSPINLGMTVKKVILSQAQHTLLHPLVSATAWNPFLRVTASMRILLG